MVQHSEIDYFIIARKLSEKCLEWEFLLQLFAMSMSLLWSVTSPKTRFYTASACSRTVSPRWPRTPRSIHNFNFPTLSKALSLITPLEQSSICKRFIWLYHFKLQTTLKSCSKTMHSYTLFQSVSWTCGTICWWNVIGDTFSVFPHAP